MSQDIPFKDTGDRIELSIDLQKLSEHVSLHSTTTQLIVKDEDGTAILDIPQLYSTVDASETRKSVKDGMLSITLKKHSPEEHWPTLEPEKVSSISFSSSQRKEPDALPT